MTVPSSPTSTGRVLPGLLDTEAIRKDFPVLDRLVHDGRKLVYLDNAATSQKPRQVLDALNEYYEQHNANVHRGVHVLAEEATALYEGARDKVAAFINAPSRDEVIFTKNASESLNLVANMLGWADEPYRVDRETEIVITEMEHHSNIVPWQLLSQRTGAKLKWFGLTDDGRLDLSDIEQVITEQTKIVSFVLVSNILGTVNPVEAIVRRAQEVGALVLIDASQAAPHMVLDVQALGADFVAFTGHKMLGPTGIGVLWGRQELLEDLPPFLGGGEMIETVSMHSSTYAPAPHKFEAGTPPIAQAVGLGAAVDYLTAHRHGQDRRARARDHRLRARAGCWTCRTCGSSARPPRRTGAPRSPSRSATSTRTTWARCSTSRASPYASATTARGRSACGTEFPRPRERRSICTPPRPRSTPWSRGWSRSGTSSGNGGAAVKLDSMYQEVILDHYKHPHGRGLRDGQAEVHHVNPTCGDEITLRVRLDGTVIGDVSYEGQGCSISQASASVLNDLLVGKDLAEAQKIQETFLELMQSKGRIEPDDAMEEVLEDAVAFAGVSKYPARVKCALLSWMAWKDATAQALSGSGPRR